MDAIEPARSTAALRELPRYLRRPQLTAPLGIRDGGAWRQLLPLIGLELAVLLVVILPLAEGWKYLFHLPDPAAFDKLPHGWLVPLTVIVSRAAARADIAALEAAGVEIIVATGENEPARVISALDQLGERDITSVLLEGGPHLAGAFLDAGEIDELRLFLAPMLLGGSAARDPLEGGGVDRIADAVRALTLDVERVAEDLLIKARLREW